MVCLGSAVSPITHIHTLYTNIHLPQTPTYTFSLSLSLFPGKWRKQDLNSGHVKLTWLCVSLTMHGDIRDGLFLHLGDVLLVKGPSTVGISNISSYSIPTRGIIGLYEGGTRGIQLLGPECFFLVSFNRKFHWSLIPSFILLQTFARCPLTALQI